MVATITPDVVELVTVPNVELVEVGTWQAMSGVHTWAVDDLQAAVAAQDDPAYNTPIVKLGHVPVRGVEWPAVGQIVNLRLSADKQTLIGDLAGIPRWLADAMPTGFPTRSIEGEFGLTTATGTKHRFALTALALLGESEPAISTLEDVKAVFTGDGVLTPSTTVDAGRVTLTRNDGALPQVTTATVVRAAVSIDELRAAFYEATPPGSWAWIRECYVGTDAFIIVDDDDGNLFQIPWTEADGTITFGDPVAVVIEYAPAPAATSDDNEAGLVLLSRNPIPATRPTVEASMPLTEAQLTEIGLAADADAEAVTARLIELGQWAAAERDAALEAATAPGGPSVTAPELPEGVTVIDESTLSDLVAAGAAGRQAQETLRVQNRDAFLNGAVRLGKFPPARLEYWQQYYDRDEKGAREFIDKISAGALPLAPLGADGEGDLAGDDQVYASIFGAEK